MMKKLIGVLVLLIAATVSAHAQFTTVTATVTDPNGIPYAGCNGSVSFVPSPTATQQPTLSGSLFQTSLVVNQCDATGTFTIIVADNNQVTDGHAPGQQVSQWKFDICASDKKTCFSANVTITGATQNISTTIQLAAALLPPSLSSMVAGVSIASFGARADSGITDNTTIINNAIAGLPDGVTLSFPCTGGGYYGVTGQIVFKGHHKYQGPSPRSTTVACAIVSTYSGNDAAFNFVGAGYVTLSGLRLQDINSGSPPYTVASFGSTTSAENGSDILLEDGVLFAGYARKALVYSIGSELVRDFGTTYTLNGGGALYVYYTSGTDDLSACPSCYSGGGLSNTAQWHYGANYYDLSGTTTTHYVVGIASTNSNDLLWSGGYMAGENTGGVTYGYGFQFPSTIGNEVKIQGMRLEQGKAFARFENLVAATDMTISGNTLSNGTTGGTFFVDDSIGNTATGMTESGNHILTIGGSDNASGLGSTYQGANLSTLLESFPVVVTNPGNNFIVAPNVSTIGAGFTLRDLGTCTMSSGACAAQTFPSGRTYTAAPKIWLTWTGTGTCAGPLKYTVTTTTVTPASQTGTDTCQVNWFAFGN